MKKDFIFLMKEFITIALFNITPAHQPAYVTCQLCLSGSQRKDEEEKKLGCMYQDSSWGLELNRSEFNFLKPKWVKS